MWMATCSVSMALSAIAPWGCRERAAIASPGKTVSSNSMVLARGGIRMMFRKALPSFALFDGSTGIGPRSRQSPGNGSAPTCCAASHRGSTRRQSPFWTGGWSMNGGSPLMLAPFIGRNATWPTRRCPRQCATSRQRRLKSGSASFTEIQRLPRGLAKEDIHLKNRLKTMPTYVYETIPRDSSEEPERFEIRQRITEPALKKHPLSGKPVRRVISGGISTLPSKGGGSCCSSKGSCCG